MTARLGRADRGIDRLLQFGRVGRRSTVEDDEVHGQALEPPVLVCAQQLLDQLQVVAAVDADEDDWNVARHPECPQRRRSGLVPAENLARGAQRCIGVQHPIGNALELLRLLEIDAVLSLVLSALFRVVLEAHSPLLPHLAGIIKVYLIYQELNHIVEIDARVQPSIKGELRW